MTEPIEKLHPHRGDWLRDIVFGLNDGLVTTLVFVIAVSALTRTQFVTVALSELLAGGVSMGLGGFLSARTAQEVLANRIATERQEIAEEPDEERAELRAIYYEKGLRGTLLERVVSDLTADEERWCATNWASWMTNARSRGSRVSSSVARSWSARSSRLCRF